MVNAKPIWIVSNYFSHVKVAAIKLKAPLNVGDGIRFIGGENDFEQKVTNRQIHHDKVEKAKKDDEIGIVVKEKVRKGYKVFKI